MQQILDLLLSVVVQVDVVEAMGDGSLGVDMIQDFVRVCLGGCRKDDDFEVLRNVFQEAEDVGSDQQRTWKLLLESLYFVIWEVDNGFVQVQDDGESLIWVSRSRNEGRTGSLGQKADGESVLDEVGIEHTDSVIRELDVEVLEVVVPVIDRNHRLLLIGLQKNLVEVLLEFRHVGEDVLDFRELLHRILHYPEVVPNFVHLLLVLLHLREFIGVLSPLEQKENALDLLVFGEVREKQLHPQNEDHVQVSDDTQEEVVDFVEEKFELLEVGHLLVVCKENPLEAEQVGVDEGEVEDFLAENGPQLLLHVEGLAFEEHVLQDEGVVVDEEVFEGEDSLALYFPAENFPEERLQTDDGLEVELEVFLDFQRLGLQLNFSLRVTLLERGLQLDLLQPKLLFLLLRFGTSGLLAREDLLLGRILSLFLLGVLLRVLLLLLRVHRVGRHLCALLQLKPFLQTNGLLGTRDDIVSGRVAKRRLGLELLVLEVLRV